MKQTILALAAVLLTAAAAEAQTVAAVEPPVAETSLRDRLMPAEDVAALMAPAVVAAQTAESAAPTAVVVSRRGSMGYMIAGGALFVAGLLAGGDAGTVLILAGAGIGAYGLYLHFQ